MPHRSTGPKTWPSLVVLCAVSMLGLATVGRAAQAVRTYQRGFELLPGQGLSLDLPVAQLRVEAASGDRVTAELALECARLAKACQERADNIELQSEARGDQLQLSIAGMPRAVSRGPVLALHLRVPRNRDLSIAVESGDVAVLGMEGDLSIDLGVGQVQLEIPAQLCTLDLEVGLGGLDLLPAPPNSSRSGFLFFRNEVHWVARAGLARVAVDLGLGDVAVRLTGGGAAAVPRNEVVDRSSGADLSACDRRLCTDPLCPRRSSRG